MRDSIMIRDKMKKINFKSMIANDLSVNNRPEEVKELMQVHRGMSMIGLKDYETNLKKSNKGTDLSVFDLLPQFKKQISLEMTATNHNNSKLGLTQTLVFFWAETLTSPVRQKERPLDCWVHSATI